MVQLAKQAGCRVIASAGSPEKVAFLKSIGADVTINYKMEEMLDVLLKEGPINMCMTRLYVECPEQGAKVRLCDRYWDNVGGRSLDAALEAAAWHSRFIVRAFH